MDEQKSAEASVPAEPDTIMTAVPLIGSVLNDAAKGSMFGDVGWVGKVALFLADRLIALVFTKECPEKISLFKQDGFDDDREP
jgi:hypothetical protein